MKWSLRNRILVPSSALILTAIAIVCLVFFFMSRAALRSVVDDQLMQISTTGIAQTESWIEGHRNNVTQWASEAIMLNAVQNSPESAAALAVVAKELGNARKLYGVYEALNLADTSGTIIASSNQERLSNIADRQYFKDAMAGKVAMSKVLASGQTGNPVLVMAAPVKDGETIRGVFFGVLDMNTFSQKFITSIKVLQSGQCALVSESGLCIAHPDRKHILKTNLTDFDWGRTMMGMKNGHLSYDLAGAKSVAFRSSDTLGWCFISTAPDAELNAPSNRMGRIGLILGVSALVAAVLIILLVVRSITRPIQIIADHISEGSDHTLAASGQVSSSSQSLAEGASEQAASLEETSSSLEEMASMTKRNAENAQQAKLLSGETRNAADTGTKDMDEMKTAMDAIKASSDDIAKIIKTIDEIAFQTNILALNAAVEAARAGETGAGFAVVADEVRSLAQRSAQSARETAEKIEDAIKKSEHGVLISGKVAQSLAMIAEKTRKVDSIVAEIATASNEQSQGIEQVNTAVSEMDKVTQSNAANAEETASASEELNAQAKSLQEAVAGLRTLVDGSSGSGTSTEDQSPTRQARSNARAQGSDSTARPSVTFESSSAAFFADDHGKNKSDRHSERLIGRSPGVK